MRRFVIVVAAVACGGCADTSRQERAGASSSISAPASRPVDAQRSPLARLIPRLPSAGWEVLHARSTGTDLAVVGTRIPVPPRATGRLVFEARLMDGRGKLRPLPRGMGRLLDAAFSPDGQRLALVTEQGELYGWQLDQTTPRLIDGRVVAGLSFSPDSRQLAYARGDAPELDVWVAEVWSGRASSAPSTRPTRTRITRLPGPTQLPTFSPDGQQLLMVSSHSGTPAFYVTRGKTVKRLAASATRRAVALVPNTRRPASWRPGAIVFETRGAAHGDTVYVLTEAGRRRFTIHGASHAHWVGPAELAYRQTYRRAGSGDHPFRRVTIPATGGAR